MRSRKGNAQNPTSFSSRGRTRGRHPAQPTSHERISAQRLIMRIVTIVFVQASTTLRRPICLSEASLHPDIEADQDTGQLFLVAEQSSAVLELCLIFPVMLWWVSTSNLEATERVCPDSYTPRPTVATLLRSDGIAPLRLINLQHIVH